ncbi:MAG: cyclophilin-like fold protein [Anaerolineae bacterium]|nr:cyclophilin-like fold protein [Anaerolineae bacterium]
MKQLILGLAISGLAGACHAQGLGAERPSATSTTEARTMKIRLTGNGQSMTATLIDSPTTRDFAALLPLTLTVEDYASTEKIAYLPRKLSVVGAPAGITPVPGDITYYAPWGNLAIFYRGFRYSEGLIRLGSLDGGADGMEARGPWTITIEADRK